MEKEPNGDQGGESTEPEETPPPFEPDPDIVTFLERGRRQDPKRTWKATEPTNR
jgi:hypothetical protein